MRRVWFVVVLVSAVLVGGAGGALAKGPPSGHGGGGGGGGGGGIAWPGSMAAVGDSITRAYDVDWAHLLRDDPAESWSTGTDGTVDSHYLRILAHNKKVRGNAYNDAQTGADSFDLASQLASAARQGVDYVTVLMGANDLCTSTVGQMTSTTQFTTNVTTALNGFFAADPSAHVFVSSIPSIKALYGLFASDPSAQSTWSTFGICQSALGPSGDPTAVDLQEQADNAALATVCGGWPDNCTWDGGATYDYQFTTADVSTVDYFHPSVTGQAHLAQVTWEHSFWPTA